MSKFDDRVDDLRPLMESDTLLASPAHSAPGDLVEYWALLTYLADEVEKRKKDLRGQLLELAESVGATTDKGGQKFTLDGSIVMRQRRVNKTPDVAGLKSLLTLSEIDLDEAFTKQVKVVPDISKIQNLIDLGRLDEDKVEKLKKVTWALSVRPSFELLDLLDAEFSSPEKVETLDRPKRTRSTGKRRGD